MLKRVVLSAVFSCVATLGVHAADLGNTDNPPAFSSSENVPFDWNGRYVGFQIGSAAQSTEFTIPGFGLVTAGNPNGVVVGALAGVNWHNDNFLLGVEADINYANLEDSSAGIIPLTFTTNAFASLRARFGLTHDNLLLYGTAGGAYIHSSYSANTFGQVFDNDNSGFTTTWGGGVEYAFDNRVTLRLDFRHYDDYSVSKGTQQVVQSILAAHSVSSKMDVVTVALTKFF